MNRFRSSVLSAVLVVVLTACFTVAQAGPELVRSGPTLTFGKVSVPGTVASATGNPSAASAAEAPGFRFGLLGPVGLKYEAGDTDDFLEEIDDLIDELDRENVTVEEAEEVIARFDGLLETLARDGYVKVSGSAQAPGTPFLLSTDTRAGTMTLDVRFGAQARLGFLDAPLAYDSEQEVLESRTAAYIKGGRWREIGVGLGREVLNASTGRLHAGARLVHYQARLTKSVIALQDIDDEEIGDVLRDEYDSNSRTTSSLGIDLGVLWVADRYQAGLTLANINSPEFDYPVIGANCDAYAGMRQANCQSAAHFEDRVDLAETYEMRPQLTLEGAWFPFESRRWLVAASLDANETNDPVGDGHRWGSISGGYLTESWLIPGVRAGYHRNFAGSELSYLSLGLTLVRLLHVDVAWTLDRVDLDGDSHPRSAAVTAGLELAF